MKVTFQTPEEFLAEVERDKDLVDRGIVRVWRAYVRRDSPSKTGAINVSLVAQCWIHSRGESACRSLCELNYLLGCTLDPSDPNDMVVSRSNLARDELVTALKKLGLEVRSGAINSPTREEGQPSDT